MNQFEKSDADASQIDNTKYEHAIPVTESALWKIELFTLTVLSCCLYFGYYKNDVGIRSNLTFVILILNFFIFAHLLRRFFWGVKKESVLVIKALGLQTTTVFHSDFKSSKFIPWHSINDVIINEAIVMQKVIYYLAVLVKTERKGEESIIPIFSHSRPRLAELKKIYTNVQLILNN